MRKFKREFKTFEEIKILSNVASKYRYKCSCGHTMTIYPFENKTKKVCRWCGHYIYINEKEKFKDTLKKHLEKYNKED